MNDLPKLTQRLSSAAAMIREGAFVADIGTDHAYLPIALCKSGRVRGAVASDVNLGPVERARENINKYGLADKISVLHTDGLCKIDEYAPTDIMILGMGGELIARIIGDAPWTKDANVRLCLQPMTHPEILRAFLCENGYSIIDEAIAEEEKIYQIILAEYTGEADALSEAELLLGRINISRRTEELKKLARNHIKILQKRVHGKASAGENADGELALIKELTKITEEDAHDGKGAL